MRIATTTLESPGIVHTWRLHHLTDIHHGAKGFASREFRERVQEIADDPFAIWTGGGDYGDLILPTDKRFDFSTIDPEYAVNLHRIPDYYVERVAELFEPIKDKCVGFGVGNHETTIQKHYHRGVAAEVAARLGIADKYLGYRGWSIVTFTGVRGSTTLKIYQHHGWSTGRLKGRKALQAERDLGSWDFDVLLCGHDHRPDGDIWYTQRPYNNGGRGAAWRLRNTPRAIINGGSWVISEHLSDPIDPDALYDVGNDSWVASKNFRPEGVGGPVLSIIVDQGRSASDGPGRPAGFDFRLELRGSRRDF